MPSQQRTFMKECVENGLESVLPPTGDILKAWQSLYLCYFNSDFSYAKGRKLAKKYCVKNPRPSEISDALKELGI